MSLSQACCAALALVLFSSCGKEQVKIEQRTGAEAPSPALAAAAARPPTGGSSSDPGSSGAEAFEGLPPGVGVQTIEVVCTSTKRPHYRTAGNPRFGFCIDLPAQWADGESSGNGDGWSIDFNDPSVDVRIYGWNRPTGIDLRSEDRAYYRQIAGPRGAISDFVFTDGVVGACVRNGQEIQYIRPGDTYWATLYVKADEAWLRRNERHLLTIARSLRAGERREGLVEFPRPQRRLEDEVL